MWAKKVMGNLLYFGKVADDSQGEKALATWIEEQGHCLVRGRRPTPGAIGKTTVEDICNQFLTRCIPPAESNENP